MLADFPPLSSNRDSGLRANRTEIHKFYSIALAHPVDSACAGRVSRAPISGGLAVSFHSGSNRGGAR